MPILGVQGLDLNHFVGLGPGFCPFSAYFGGSWYIDLNLDLNTFWGWGAGFAPFPMVLDLDLGHFQPILRVLAIDLEAWIWPIFCLFWGFKDWIWTMSGAEDWIWTIFGLFLGLWTWIWTLVGAEGLDLPHFRYDPLGSQRFAKGTVLPSSFFLSVYYYE